MTLMASFIEQGCVLQNIMHAHDCGRAFISAHPLGMPEDRVLLSSSQRTLHSTGVDQEE